MKRIRGEGEEGIVVADDVVRIQTGNKESFTFSETRLARMLVSMEHYLSRIQENNHATARSTLKTVVATLPKLEKIQKMMINGSKNVDDQRSQRVYLDVYKRCLETMREKTSSSFIDMLGSNHYMNTMIIEPDHYINMRALFEQCIVIIALMIEFLGERARANGSYDAVIDERGWVSWQRIIE